MAKEMNAEQPIEGITTSGKDDLRMKSTGKPSSRTKGDESTVPHYLRASTGSCHDVCKYGKLHTFEAKPRCPIKKQFPARPKEDQIPVEFLVCSPRRTKKVAQAHVDEESAVVKAPLTIQSFTSDLPLPEESNSAVSYGIVHQEPDGTSSSSPCTKFNSKPACNLNADGSSSSAPIKAKYARNMWSSRCTEGLKSETKMSSINSRTSNLAEGNILATGPTSLSTKAKTASRVAAGKASIPATNLSPRTYPGSKATSSIARKNGNKSQNHTKVFHGRQEKTVEAETTSGEEKRPSNSLLQQFSGSLSSHEVDDDLCESEEVNRRPSNNGKLRSEEKISAAVKLTLLSRRKVVQSQCERSTSTRQKFRRGRALDEARYVIGNLQRKTFKRRAADGIANDTKPVAEKVVLKHQDVLVLEEKRGQVLLNNVIEETASKLIETRKSKVQALVGAFETVISLQGKKQYPDNLSEARS